MGLVNKLKNILFEEEEVEIPVIEKKVEQPKAKQEEIKVTSYENFNPEPVKQIKEREEIEPIRTREVTKEEVNEREILKPEKSFTFPAFDEKEFEEIIPRRSTNVMEYERKKNRAKIPKKDISKKEEVEVKTKFKPSPIISPVYGILDKNYTPEDITSREEPLKALDVDSVRKKAFGTLEEDILDIPLKEDNKVEEKLIEEKMEKARTIDELLKDSTDEIIDLDQYIDDEDINSVEDLKPDYKEHDNLEESFKDLEVNSDIAKKEDESLENDLFDLIDSMYENREDGE